MASLAAAWGVGVVAGSLSERRPRATVGGLALILSLLAHLAVGQARVFQSDDALWSRAWEHNPQSVRAAINLAAARVLDRLGIQALPAAGCCGALSHHLSQEEQTLATARKNIDSWWPLIESGAEAVVLTASGCAPTVMDYSRMLEHDP